MAFFAITVPCATPTTTTTTTVAPITFTATPSCVAGSGQIAVTSYAGGNGSYQWIAISSISRNDAIFQAAAGTRFAAGSSYTFSSLANGNYWIALRDTAGNTGATNDPGINIACATTTTTTSTTTTTTTLAYTVTVYMRQGTTPTPNGTAFLYTYTTNSGSLTYRGPISDTTCQSFPVSTFTVPAGTTLNFVVQAQDQNVSFNAALSTTCPSNSATYCTFSQTINANTNIAITAYVAKFGTYVPC